MQIKHFSVSKKIGNDDVLRNSKSSLNIVAKLDSFVPEKHNEEAILSISQLQKVFTDQSVTIKATIKSLNRVKKVFVCESSIDKKDHAWLTLPARLEQYLKEAVKDNRHIFKRFRRRSQPNFIINSTTTQPKFTIIQETAIFFN